MTNKIGNVGSWLEFTPPKFNAEEFKKRVEAMSQFNAEEFKKRVEAMSQFNAEEFKKRVEAKTQFNAEEFKKRVEAKTQFNAEEFKKRVEATTQFNAEEFKKRVEAKTQFNAEEFKKRVEAINNIDITKLQKRLLEIEPLQFENILSVNKTLLNFSDVITGINFDDIEIEEEDIDEFYEKTKNEEVVKTTEKELKSGKKITKKTKKMISILFFTMGLVFDISPQDLVNSAYNIVKDNYYNFNETGEIISLKENHYWISREINYLFSEEDDFKNMRKVIKNNLIVRDGIKLNTKIKGKLNKDDVIEIIEKKRNRTYIIFYDREKDKVIKGWVSTRYLKK